MCVCVCVCVCVYANTCAAGAFDRQHTYLSCAQVDGLKRQIAADSSLVQEAMAMRQPVCCVCVCLGLGLGASLSLSFRLSLSIDR